MLRTFRVMTCTRIVAVVTLAMMTTSVSGTSQGRSLPQRRISDVAINDVTGAHHRLFRYKADRGIVLYSQMIGCPIVNVSLPKLAALRDRYEARGFRFLLYNSADETSAALRQWATEFGVTLPMLQDRDQLLLNELGVDRSGVATVVDTASRRIVFQGAIDDQTHYEVQKPSATVNYLADALDAVLAGRPVAVPVADSLGCLFTPKGPSMPLSAAHYATRVGPLVREKCVTCHRAGGAGPFAFTSFEQLRRWSAMARETVLSGRMAPYDADPDVGRLAFNTGLTGEEKRDLIRWIDAGTPRGGGEDPLLAPLPSVPEWPDGTPDLVLTVPAFQVPATGVVAYQYPAVATGLKEDTWVRRVVIKPSSEAVTHHVLAFTEPIDSRRPSQLTADDWVGVFSPGVDLTSPGMAESGGGTTAMLLKAGATLYLQAHYTTIGKPVSNAIRIGLYLHRGTPAYRLRTLGIPSDLSIPPGVADYPAAASLVLPEDIVLYGLYPHMHYRGSRARFDIVPPGSTTREALLSVPRYRFNWQTIYYLAEPRRLRKGTEVHFSGAFDNSADHPGNPDPTRRVPFGEQSWDEMFIGYLLYGVPVR